MNAARAVKEGRVREALQERKGIFAIFDNTGLEAGRKTMTETGSSIVSICICLQPTASKQAISVA